CRSSICVAHFDFFHYLQRDRGLNRVAVILLCELIAQIMLDNNAQLFSDEDGADEEVESDSMK
ncbi:unnamed protein product, partial [Amoebophrya sp. A25]